MEVFGRHGDRLRPRCLDGALLTGKHGAGLDPAAALLFSGVTVQPGADFELVFVLGEAASEAMQWLDRIDATGQAADRGVLLQGLRLTQPATASAVQHLLELRHRMVAAEFLVTAWPPLVVASGKSGGDPSPGKR